MGLFNNFKNLFKNENKQEVKTYDKGLEKTRNNFTSKLNNLILKHKNIDDDFFDELEEILISSDIGVNTVINFVDKLKARVVKEHIVDSNDLKEIIVDEMVIIYVNGEVITNKINFNQDGPTIILFVGVNGVGKTTTIGKLASKFKNAMP